MERTLINGLLVKLGVELPERFDDDRAANKVKTRLAKLGIPKDLTAEETKLVEGLGFTASPAAPEAPTASAPKPKGKTKAATPAPAGKTKTGKGKAAVAPAAAAKKEPKAKGDTVADLFRGMFPNKSTVLKKADVLAKLEKAGILKGSASIYVSWAKRGKARKPGTGPAGNPWGFQLEEGKNKEGEKTLRRIKDL